VTIAIGGGIGPEQPDIPLYFYDQNLFLKE
jgi:hypothetical protein